MLGVIWALSALLAFTEGQSTTVAPLSSAVYTVIAPAKLRPNIPFHVSASVHNLPAPLDLKITIEGPADNGQYNTIGKQITLNSGETQILNFEIGEWSSGNYSLIVEGDGGLKFRNQTVLTYEHKSYSVFIQTDKAIYKPGQLVQFRVLVVNPHLLPSVTGAINMYITDASGNRIKQWGKVFTTKGIASAELLLSDQPVLGDWTINVDILGQMFKKTFTVAEYVLPNFEVQIALPPYVTYNKPDFVATVSAKYTYGKPVKGHVKLLVKPSLRFGYLANENKPAVTEAEIDGSVDIPINLARDLGLKEDTMALEIDVIAEVEEYLTKRKYNATNILKVYDRDIKVEMVKSSESFKPGLKYTAHLKVCYQDDTPVVVTNGDQIVLKYGYTYDERQWDSRRIAVPNNGLLSVDFYPPVNTNASSLSMNAEFRGFDYNLDNVEAAMSPSNSFIQVLLRTENPTVDKEVELEVNATEPLSQLVYEVLGRGDIVLAGAIDVPNVKTYRFYIPVTHKMAPKARIVVFYVRPENNEIVADAVNFDVSGTFRTPVSINTNVKETKPGAPVNVTVATKPNALVGLLGIDQSVLLLKSGNDITQNDVITELETYDGGKKRYQYGPYYRKKRSLWWPGSATAHDVFDDSGVVVLTNGLVYRYIQLIMYRSYSGAIEDELNAVDTMLYDHGNGKGSKPRVRKHFPETWIWDLLPAGNDGKLSLVKNIPDTITSWVISAFAMDPVNGLGIAPDTAKVTVFRPFFVKLNLPYSVVRGESLYLEAIVFNYNKKPMKAVVTLENKNDDFEFTVAGNEIGEAYDKMSKSVEVPAEDGVSVMFLITPKSLGYIDIKVSAVANNAGDAVVRKLLVKPEGAPQYFNKAILVDLRDTNSKKFEETVEISIPEEAVPGSGKVSLSAIGDLLGPTVNNLDKLLRMPQGCGEQNMLNFVPNIVITKYLKRVNRLTPTIQKKSLNFMESGYQRELTYRRNDGSFSAFGNNDKNGSTWLTAFVVRSFHQAKEFMEIDDGVMTSALEWLSRQQKSDGSFDEPGEIHHKAMQGGSGSKSALTAYVLLAFLENQAQKTFAQEMDKATKYLLRELKNSQDPYFVSIVTYAFHLSEHEEKDTALQKLLSLSTRGVDTIHWQKPKDNSMPYYEPQSQDVEMTAYALLTYSVRGDVAGALPILRWMISQQNEYGGYSSTQDTVVGIQALASLGVRLASASISINISYNFNDMQKTLSINSDNAMVLQNVILPSDVRSVALQAEGFGVGLVQVTWSYNVAVTDVTPAFSLKPVLGKASTDDYMELDICTRYKESGASNMAVMEVGLPSGFEADTEILPMIKNLDKIKRVETNEGDTNVVIYFDRIDNEEVCVHVPAFRSHKVANPKPVPVKVYDYYDLSKSARMFYEPKSVTLCEVCEGEDCGSKCNELTDGVNASSTPIYNLFLIALAAMFTFQIARANY
ncbi:CD109 antigen isoform X2 [Parasteatoda tepidariorum]|uniref:CD109 antigen isoform X2 n=1 Tax=Parasteatoda tepidariorum TaxID=114398 RepID=UPI001C727A15|nr:CD109 antigen isoform X2 [Parasteatoda tepidariorum]XP_015930766.2 CD109 antigen isoform X2 [Parasteatoda tepidariorum]XP_042896144.1 CD109 antigen isoform X2 [Parasteatoda tepidariorum]